MVFAAHLRVYLPEGTGSQWRVHVPPPSPERVVTLSDLGLWLEPLTDDAHRIEWNGRTWLCPRHPRLRMLEGVLAVRAGHVSSVANVLVPERMAEVAAAELARIRRRRPDARSFILTAPWHVPLRWFALFHPNEREDYEDPAGHPSLRYRTSLMAARQRIDRTAVIVEDAGFADPIVEAVTSLADWLGGFADEAVVELDYGTVAQLFDAADLATDDSVEQVAQSLDALERGDFDAAQLHYANVAGRWAMAQALMISS